MKSNPPERTKIYLANGKPSAAWGINLPRHLPEKGLAPPFFSTVCYKNYKLFTGEDTEEGKAQNRRIEVILLPKE